MWFPDGRKGSLFLTDLQARIAGKFPKESTQAVFLVEQEEAACHLTAVVKVCAIYPTHGPLTIRILADYRQELGNRPVVIFYENDRAGRTWAHRAARILIQHTTVRLWTITEPVREWLTNKTQHDLLKGLKRLRPVTTEELHSDPLAGGENPALRLLEMSGARLVGDAVGIWEDMDSTEVLDALETLECTLPIVYLNDPALAEYWRVRQVPTRKTSETFRAYELRTAY